MSMSDWAKKEVELAKIIEAKDLKEGEFDYGGACYDSALKAFKSLAEKFDTKLDGILDDFNDQLQSVQKIYSSIAKSIARD